MLYHTANLNYCQQKLKIYFELKARKIQVLIIPVKRSPLLEGRSDDELG